MTKTPEQINKAMYEAIYGCSHEDIGVGHRGLWVCEDCREKLWRDDVVEEYTRDKDFKIIDTHYKAKIPNYLEHDEPWGEMLRWAKEQEWWSDFLNKIYLHLIKGNEESISKWELSATINYALREVTEDLFADPTALATVLTEYLKREEGR